MKRDIEAIKNKVEALAQDRANMKILYPQQIAEAEYEAKKHHENMSKAKDIIELKETKQKMLDALDRAELLKNAMDNAKKPCISQADYAAISSKINEAIREIQAAHAPVIDAALRGAIDELEKYTHEAEEVYKVRETAAKLAGTVANEAIITDIETPCADPCKWFHYMVEAYFKRRAAIGRVIDDPAGMLKKSRFLSSEERETAQALLKEREGKT